MNFKNVKKLYLKKEKTTNWQLDISKIKLKNGSISEIFNQIFLKYNPSSLLFLFLKH